MSIIPHPHDVFLEWPHCVMWEPMCSNKLISLLEILYIYIYIYMCIYIYIYIHIYIYIYIYNISNRDINLLLHIGSHITQ